MTVDNMIFLIISSERLTHVVLGSAIAVSNLCLLANYDIRMKSNNSVSSLIPDI